ncbi:MAG TPA: sugar-transfer associated ATP-grasp domain-containing protein [Geminicoccus sp.]|jgi:hypothetical protein|uniref:sugar-transfer associated ATP-grasp domain-containing protein n=1 Tax=Geminicoccus sp. TaxID=2024832 RepID=UPI002E35D7B2|nr:sugar-transfer associated ATP-grasp domain-containing protein [Geminicoccus sp.]HEX2527576.1 sugar-transfer associated ATP-grasp domain-containing protein [Geminicoccus sp.]
MASDGFLRKVGKAIHGLSVKPFKLGAEAGSLAIAAARAGAGPARPPVVQPGGETKAAAADRAAAGKPKPTIDLAEALREAAAISGKPVGRMLREIVALRRGPGRLTAQEYFYYRLYDDRHTDAERQAFRGHAAQTRIYERTSPRRWWLLAHDKLLFHAVAQGLGYPTPEILAVYPPARAFGRVPSPRDAAELADLLRGGMRYPCFAKPVRGMFSHGAHAIMAFDQASDALRFWNGSTMDLATFSSSLDPRTDGGYVFQALQAPHPAIAAVCGPRLATVRLVVALRPSGPMVLRALWKVPAGANIADNFWRPGNILCALDPQTGRVLRAVRGYGLALEEPELHPDSGARLLGFTLPGWHELVALTLDAARSFAPLRFQAWDVAMCPDGPLLVELNVGGDFDLPQLATDRGIMDKEFAAFLAECDRDAVPI